MRQGNKARQVAIQARPFGDMGEERQVTREHGTSCYYPSKAMRCIGQGIMARRVASQGHAVGKATRHVARQQGKRQGNMASRARPAEASNPL